MKIAILTSGGDSQGMNLALKGALDRATAKNIELYKVRRGYEGLIDDEISRFEYADIVGRENNGGSAIMISRSNRFLQKKYQKIAFENLRTKNINHLIVIGGNGSFKGAIDLIKLGLNIICVPATVDNDLNFDMSLGFDSAANNAISAIDNILDCTSSIGAGVAVEVMGRKSGDLAKYVGKALNAEYVLTRDTLVDYKEIAKIIKKYLAIGVTNPLIIVQEKFIDLNDFVTKISQNTNFKFKSQILGYIQRGGRPSAYDRVYGYELGVRAVDLLLANINNVAVGRINKELITQDIEKSIMSKTKFM